MFSFSDLNFSQEFLDQLAALMNLSFHIASPLREKTPVVSELSLIAAIVALITVISTRNMMERRSNLIKLNQFSLLPTLFYSVVITFALWTMLGSRSEVFLYFNF